MFRAWPYMLRLLDYFTWQLVTFMFKLHFVSLSRNKHDDDDDDDDVYS